MSYLSKVRSVIEGLRPAAYRWRWVLLALFLVLAAALAANWLQQRPRTVYVALLERFDHKEFGDMHILGLQHYLEELSEDFPSHRFVLKPFFIDDDPDILRKKYEQIARDDDYVLAIDNTWARHLQSVDSVIRERGIPVLSLNADKGQNDFARNAIFIGHSDHAPADMATYVDQVLKPTSLAFISEGDYWLLEEFEKEFAARNIELDLRWLAPDSEPTDLQKKEFRETFTRWAQTAPKPISVLLNVHNSWGHEVIDFIDQNFDGITILGASYAVSEGRSNRFGLGPRENRLILLTEPEDAVSSRVRKDVKLFKSKHPDVFLSSFNSPFYVKRCLDAVEIVRIALEQRESEITPDFFRDFFQRRAIGNTLSGRYDLYAFDREGRRIPEVSFVEFDSGIATSLPQQLNAERAVIPTVFFGIDLLDIGRLDPIKGRFQADFYYWVKLDPQHAVMADYVHFRNLSLDDRRTQVEDAADGSYRLERISGEFTVELDMADYPLDEQELTLQLDLANPFDDVRVAFDYAGFEDSRRNVESFDIPGWRVTDYDITVDNIVSKSLKGVGFKTSKEPRKYKTLTVRVSVQRKIQGALATIGLPLAIIGIAALSLLFIRDARITKVGDVYTGIFLSIVTYSIAFAQITPASGVTTKADQLFYLTFLVVLIVFLRFVTLNVRYSGDHARIEPRHSGKGLAYALLAAYGTLTFWILLN